MHATLGLASYDFHSLDVCTVCVPSKLCLHVSVANCKLLISVVIVRGGNEASYTHCNKPWR